MAKVIQDRNHYNRVHYLLRTKYGKPTRCDFEKKGCSGISNNYEWALKKGSKYTENPKDYLHLCKSCHSKYDGYTLSEEGRESLKKNAIKNFKGKPSHKKGKGVKVKRVCKKCGDSYKSHVSKNIKYCSKKCSYSSKEYRKKKVYQLDKKGVLICTWNSIKEANESTMVSVTAICNNLYGRSKSAGGYIWKHVN